MLALWEMRIGVTSAQERLLWLFGAIASLAGCLLSWLRYHREINLAEHVAELATCPACGTYGRLKIVGSKPHSASALTEEALREDVPCLKVRCRNCDAAWEIVV
jgi:hypothetical protein